MPAWIRFPAFIVGYYEAQEDPSYVLVVESCGDKRFFYQGKILTRNDFKNVVRNKESADLEAWWVEPQPLSELMF